MISGSLWNYNDEVNGSAKNSDDNDDMINNNKTTTSKFFEYKTKIIESIPNNNNILNAEVVVKLKYLSNFWRSLDLLLINCEIELDLRWTKNCVMTEISRRFRAVSVNADPVVYEVAIQTTGATLQIKL